MPDPSLSRLSVRHRRQVDVPAACVALGEPEWIGTLVEPSTERPTFRRYVADLALPLAGERRTISFKKAAYVEIGPLRKGVADCEVELAWRSATLAPLFPVFVGRLVVTASGLRLDGAYSPPGGNAGVLIDRAFLHLVASRTAHWFVEQVAQRLDADTRSD